MQAVVQKPISSDADRTRGNDHSSRIYEPRIGELEIGHEIVLAGGGEELRLVPVDLQLKDAQKARVSPVQPLSIDIARANIAARSSCTAQPPRCGADIRLAVRQSMQPAPGRR